jgi:hypothetical protein
MQWERRVVPRSSRLTHRSQELPSAGPARLAQRRSQTPPGQGK